MKYLLLLLHLCIFFFSYAQEDTLEMDETKPIPPEIHQEVGVFMDSLYAVCQRKDTAALYDLVDKDLYLFSDIGGEGFLEGLQGFKERWGLNSHPEQSSVWTMFMVSIDTGWDVEPGTDFQYTGSDVSILLPKGTSILDMTGSGLFFSRVNIKANLPIYIAPHVDSLIVGHLPFLAGVNAQSTYKTTEANSQGPYNTKNNPVFGWMYNYVDEWVHISLGEAQTGWVQGRYFFGMHWKFTVMKIDNHWKIARFNGFG